VARLDTADRLQIGSEIARSARKRGVVDAGTEIAECGAVSELAAGGLDEVDQRLVTRRGYRFRNAGGIACEPNLVHATNCLRAVRKSLPGSDLRRLCTVLSRTRRGALSNTT